MSHFLDRLNYFSQPEGDLRRRPRRGHRRGPHLGGRLPQPLGARQDRALDARRQLHRLVLAGRSTSRAASSPGKRSRPTTRARAGTCPTTSRAAARAARQLQLVPVQRQPREVPDGARPPAQALARGAHRRSDPVEAWASIVEDDAKRRDYQQVRGLGGFVRSSWDEVNEIVAAANVYTIKKHGPDRVIGFSPIPAMSMVSYAAGSRYLSA